MKPETPSSFPQGRPPTSTAATASLPSPMQHQADPLADDTIARILGPWPAGEAALDAPQWQRIATVNRLIAEWTDNACLATWQAQGPGVDATMAAALAHYLQEARQLPAWTDPARMNRAEAVFMKHGALSCILLFCASLPECYVIPDLASVLHTTGQLEQHTESRIRATAAMIFPVMMLGGMTHAQGAGVAQVLKVRLIHATIRNLILRGSPAHFVAAQAQGAQGTGGPLAALALPGGPRSMHQALFARGWDAAQKGLPCNQEELAYTLLTFGYVFLRGQRRLGLGLSAQDEQAFLHGWNVVGHVLGIDASLMVHTMEEGQALFERLQAQGRAHPITPDPRPPLAQALMQAMAQALPWKIAQPFPVMMTRWLCGPATAADLGLTQRAPWASRLLFWGLLWLAKALDAAVRTFLSQFSILRMLVRVLGYHFMTRLLMSQTRPLQLPDALLGQIDSTVAGWSTDPDAPAWVTHIENWLTTQGSWSPGLAAAAQAARTPPVTAATAVNPTAPDAPRADP